jgi:hypothetical protein
LQEDCKRGKLWSILMNQIDEKHCLRAPRAMSKYQG